MLSLSSLPNDLIEHILSFLIQQPIRTSILSTKSVRYLLPFALTCRRHYRITISAIHGLSILPLRFPAYKPDNNIPPFPQCLRDISPPLKSSKLSIRTDISTHNLCDALRIRSHLHTLHLSLAVRITDAGMLSLVPLLQNLRHLCIRGNEAITLTTIKALRQCPKLCHLDLSYCSSLGDDCAPYIRQMHQLRSLEISDWKVTDSFVRLISSLPTLQQLSLCTCPAITSQSCHYLGRFANNLNSLKLKACVNVDDDGVAALSGCKSLQLLDLSMVRGITDNAAVFLGDALSFPSLNTLMFSQCMQLSTSAFVSLSHNPNITSLDFSFCYFLTDAISQSFRFLSNLQHLDLSGCSSLSDDTAKEIARLPKLTHLRLTSCVGFTNRSAQHISSAVNIPLQLVDVRGCKFSLDATSSLRNNCIELRASWETESRAYSP